MTKIELPVAAPFNLEATVRLLQRRPTNGIDVWEDGQYLRAFHTAEGVRLVTVSNDGPIDAPSVWLEIRGGATANETRHALTLSVRWMLGLDAESAPIAWLAAIEPRLATVAEAMRGFRPPCFPDLFETCARVIPFQQLSIDAGTAIVRRLAGQLGPGITIGDRAWIAFPGPEAFANASTALLRDAGLSRTKSASLQELARLALEGELDGRKFQALSTDAAFARLRSLPGIGPWSAGLILLRGLRRLDVFPAGDVGAARNLSRLLALPAPLTPTEAVDFAGRFGARQGYLYFLALGGQLLEKGVPLGN